MSEKTTVKLPSGAELVVTPAPFADAKALNQAVMREMAHVPIEKKGDVFKALKEMFSLGFSSPEIDRCLTKCFARCTYDGGKLSDECFEPLPARDDYVSTCLEVLKVNVGPFLKSLYAVFQEVSQLIPESSPASRPPTTT